MATNPPAPKTQEKTVPSSTPNSSNVKAVVTTKPSVNKPTPSIGTVVKPPVSTVPSKTTSQTKNPSSKVITQKEKIDLTKAELRNSKSLSIPNIVLAPKKSKVKTSLGSGLPLESHELPDVENAVTKVNPKQINVSLPKVQPKNGAVKTISSLPLEERETALISPLKLKSSPKSVPVKVSPSQVYKTKVKVSSGIPSNMDPEPISTNAMTKKSIAVPDVVIAKPDVKSAPKVVSDGIPMEGPATSTLSTRTVTPEPVIASVNADSTIQTSTYFGIIEFKPFSSTVHGIYKLDVIEPAFDSVYWDADLFIVIAGHTNDEGNTTASMKLSQARADAVRAIFLKKGMPTEKIQTMAYGDTKPLKNNSTEEEKQHNRRVEIHVLRKKHP
ncbi:MAG: OmpA family protein [Bacteroidetes bacterium]|nr:OmpA family protein [Bacteroidota bacterium]